MNNSTSPCNDNQLHVLLRGEEHEDSFRWAAEHLESCTGCQSRLTELAADQSEWSEMKQSLAMDERERRIEQEQAERSWSVFDHQHPPKTWTDSMTRQLLSPPSHPEMLGRLGRYEIERLIGVGGMGVVFKGFDSELNRPVAIKVLAPHLANSGAARQRFAREARAAAAIVHEHVVAIHNVESDSESPFLVMQYVAGQSLQCRLDRDGPLSLCEVLRIARQTAAGLAAAHEQGLVHRDVKPSNILLELGVDRALLSDFGLARASDDASLTQSGHAPGTPNYMSPEQALGNSVDYRSDLFSLGSVMYAMCTGRPSFRAETSYGVLRRITDEPHRPIRQVNPDVPDWLAEIIDLLLAKDPDQRFQSAAEVVETLGAWLAHVQQPDVVPPPQHKRGSATNSNGGRSRFQLFKLLMGGAFACLLVFAGVLFVLELNKGTLTIECASDAVPVRIMKGEKVYDRMTVTPRDNSVRIGAGQYVVEIEGDNDRLRVENNVVTIERGGVQVVRIVESPPVAQRDASEIQGHWRLERVDVRGDLDSSNLSEGMKLIISGATATMVHNGGRWTQGILVNASSEPKTLTFIRRRNGRRYESHGIYRFTDNGRLVIVFSANGSNHRPLTFDDENALVQVWMRVDENPQAMRNSTASPRSDVLTMTGILEYDARLIVNVHTRVPGRIEKLAVDYIGVDVNEGDPLVMLHSGELYSAEEEFVQAYRTNRSQSSSKNARILESTRERLCLMGLSDEEIDQLAIRNRASGRLTLSAPRNGIVTAMEAKEGESVNSDARLFTIADLTRLWAKLHVNEAQLELFRFNQPVTLTAHAYPDEPFPGRVLFIEPTIDSETRSIVVQVEVSNPQSKLKPGMSVTARMQRPASAGLDTDFGNPFNNVESDGASIARDTTDGTPPFSMRRSSGPQSKLSDANKAAEASVTELNPLVQLERIGRAMQEYHQQFGHFPPATVVGPDGETLHSWRVELLPLLGYQDLYDEYHLNEPWDSGHNKSLIKKMPVVYRSNDGEQRGPTYARWLAVTGPETVFYDKTGTRAMAIHDGMSNTAMLVEATNSIPWTKPEDLVIGFDGASSSFKPTSRNGFHMLLCDGSPCFVAKSTPHEIIDAFLTRSSGEELRVRDVKRYLTFHWVDGDG